MTIFLTVCLAGSACAHGLDGEDSASAQNTKFAQTADSVIEAAVTRGDVPGAALLISRQGEIVHGKAHGYALHYDVNLVEVDGREPMTTDHIFDLASLTKVTATALAVMLLSDRDQVDLDDTVHRHIPGFSGGGRDSITIRHLLTHTSGLPPWRPLYIHARGREETIRIISETSLAYAPGSDRRYSDLGFILLGYLIEEVAGAALDEFLMENLYEPLGMRHTSFNPLAHGFADIAATSHGNPFEKRMIDDPDFGYNVPERSEQFDGWRTYTLKGEVNDGNAFYALDGVAGHAGLFSTASDLHVLLELLMNRGSYEGKRFLSAEIVQEFLTPDDFGNGLGWWMDPRLLGRDELPEGTFWHPGFTGTFMMGIPERSVGIILLTNRQHGGMGPDGYVNLAPLHRDLVQTVLEGGLP